VYVWNGFFKIQFSFNVPRKYSSELEDVYFVLLPFFSTKA